MKSISVYTLPVGPRESVNSISLASLTQYRFRSTLELPVHDSSHIIITANFSVFLHQYTELRTHPLSGGTLSVGLSFTLSGTERILSRTDGRFSLFASTLSSTPVTVESKSPFSISHTAVNVPAATYHVVANLFIDQSPPDLVMLEELCALVIPTTFD
jgi:hypothetical protein